MSKKKAVKFFVVWRLQVISPNILLYVHGYNHGCETVVITLFVGGTTLSYHHHGRGYRYSHDVTIIDGGGNINLKLFDTNRMNNVFILFIRY